MNICFFTKYEITWGSSRERIGIYLEMLRQKGHRYRLIHLIPDQLSRIYLGKADYLFPFRKIYSFWHNRILRYLKCLWLIKIAGEFDLIVIQKVNLPCILLRWLRTRNKNIIFDFDDLCFLTEGKRPAGICDKMRLWWGFYQDPGVLGLFSYIIAGNPYLADIALGVKDKSDVGIIPTSIDCALYFPVVKKDNSPLVIGFTGAGENHLRHLELLVKPFDALSKNYRFIFKLIGAMYSRKIKSLFGSSGYEFVCIDWLSIEKLAEEVRTFDIGVMPLKDDDEARGKCGFKALQYMASGIPVVISPIGINNQIVEDNVNGFLAENDSEWIEKLSLLIENKELRERFSQKGRKTVEEFYSFDRVSKAFIDTIERFSTSGRNKCTF